MLVRQRPARRRNLFHVAIVVVVVAVHERRPVHLDVVGESVGCDDVVPRHLMVLLMLLLLLRVINLLLVLVMLLVLVLMAVAFLEKPRQRGRVHRR